MKKALLIVSLLGLSACTDSAKASLRAIGDEAQVYFYFGGQQIYNGSSTGRVYKSGMIQFIEKETEKYIEIHADSIVKYK